MTGTTDAVISVLIVLLGAPAGSFGALLADRLPRGEPVVLTRSRCRTCGTSLRAADLIPILSWLWLRGRCRTCGAALPAHLLLAEVAGFGLGLAAVLVTHDSAEALLGAALLWCLLALALSDLRHYVLPDALNLSLLVLALGLALLPHAAQALPGPGHVTPGAAVLGAVLGAGAFWVLGQLYRWRHGRTGLGAGDVKLMAGIGAMTGAANLPVATLIGALAGLALAILRGHRRNRRLRRHMPVPFGACLALGGAVVWLGVRALP